jgi:transposase
VRLRDSSCVLEEGASRRMAQYLSADLRMRVIRAVEGGMSRNAAARRFGVSVASAVRWMDDYVRTGRSAPKPRGGDRRSGRIEAQSDLLMSAVEATPDITLAELRALLMAERGETFALSTIHDFFRRHGITFKKRPRMPASRLART